MSYNIHNTSLEQISPHSSYFNHSSCLNENLKLTRSFLLKLLKYYVFTNTKNALIKPTLTYTT